MRLNGLSLFRDAKQVITGIYFRSIQSSGRVHFDQSDILESVRKREIDFGFVRAEIIAGLESSNATRGSYFKQIGSWNATMPGTSAPYPFLVSSMLLPEWALLAYPHVAYEAKLAVVRALLQLNRSSPEAVRARYAAWQLAEVYQGVVNVLDAMQAFAPLTQAQSGRQCFMYAENNSDYDAVACPAGTYKILEAEAIQNCRIANLSCGPQRVCWCRPCRQSAEFEVRLLPAPPDGPATASGDAAPCLKMQVCLSVAQGAAIVPALRDSRRRAGLVAAFRLRDLEGGYAVARGGPLLAEEGPPGGYRGEAMAARRAGLYALEVLVGDAQIGDSPFLVRIAPARCARRPGLCVRRRRAWGRGGGRGWSERASQVRERESGVALPARLSPPPPLPAAKAAGSPTTTVIASAPPALWRRPAAAACTWRRSYSALPAPSSSRLSRPRSWSAAAGRGRGRTRSSGRSACGGSVCGRSSGSGGSTASR
jgi:hypothetical protein